MLAGAESDALRLVVDGAQELASSALLAVELRRAVNLAASANKLTAAQTRELNARADGVIGQLVLIEVDDEVIAIAGKLEPPTLRTLRALHVATAGLLRAELDAVVTYDRRMVEASRLAGLPTLSPA